MNIVPGILATTLDELRAQLERVAWAKKIHIDIMDGRFVDTKTIDAKTLARIFPDTNVQIHLMAERPERHVDAFSKMGCEDLIVHAEATRDTSAVLDSIRQAGMKSGIAFNPETGVRAYKDALGHADISLIMTVHPGASGQRLMRTPLRKIRQIKRANPRTKVGVDGGFNHTTCNAVSHAGADFAIATSAVTQSPDPKRAYKALSSRTARE